jgi:ABC-type antimicrobial peptide transport system permease subunit
MDDVVGTSVGQPRFTSQLAGFFAVVALLLGALGIHGVLSYVVAQRVGELGVRLALGARPAALLKLVVGQGMRLAGLGVAIGVVAALAGARVLRGLLFGVGPSDPVSFLVAIAVLGAAAFLACYGPGRRAARIDPMTALRAE